jgi:hypothetical protein
MTDFAANLRAVLAAELCDRITAVVAAPDPDLLAVVAGDVAAAVVDDIELTVLQRLCDAADEIAGDMTRDALLQG